MLYTHLLPNVLKGFNTFGDLFKASFNLTCKKKQAKTLEYLYMVIKFNNSPPDTPSQTCELRLTDS